MTAIHVAKVHVPVTALGPGRRVGIWLQGCSIGCRECVSQDTWPSSIGETSVAALLPGVTAALRADATLTGVTISGGEPLEQAVALAELPMPPSLELQRLKRQKLALKDRIARLEDELNPGA